ncbi:hypothetical protein B0A50_06575 [Salinomyces thailandicus]|uniref:Uncharacterized protein n=1 Tax=Salinomyces thailandicus TaxID=706561 RepID=A0A4U0TSE0_9PEZI|nr:hypothetical protein B0A50_06575 [Salinomyces thailandica]
MAMQSTRGEVAIAWATTAVALPTLLIFSVPLVIFAAITTTLAFWLLLWRVLAVHVDLFTALLRAWLAGPAPKPVPFPTSPGIVQRQQSPKSHRPSRSSSSRIETKKFANQKSQSSAEIAIGMPLRDYEGVGGWRLEGDEEEEALWMGMNSRLQLPSSQVSLRRKSTTGSRVQSGRTSPELVRTPLAVRTAMRSRPESPEGYFTMPLNMTPTVDRNSKVSFEDQRRSTRSSSISLGSTSSFKLTRYDAT